MKHRKAGGRIEHAPGVRERRFGTGPKLQEAVVNDVAAEPEAVDEAAPVEAEAEPAEAEAETVATPE